MSDRYGPQTTEIEALLDRVRNLTDDEAQALADAWDAVWDACDAAWVAACADAWDAWVAAWDAAWDAWDAIWDVCDATRATRDVVLALVVRDLIGQHGFTQTHYDTLVAPWESVMGTEWTREKGISLVFGCFPQAGSYETVEGEALS